MKLAIMQPYFFPYLGYYQLVANADKFVFYDDVNFIKRGWINRNRVLLNGRPHYLTVPLSHASQFAKINEIRIHQDGEWEFRLLESIRYAYAKAPYFSPVLQLIREIVSYGDERIAPLAARSVMLISQYLELDTKFVESSAIYGNADLAGPARVIDICLREKAKKYYNAPGGRDLYDEASFLSHGVELCFVEPNLVEYQQFSPTFHPALSIIDVLMFHDREEVREMLKPDFRAYQHPPVRREGLMT
ncbi:WbqC family protein [Noviherbaspirillum sp. Root189]|uniref:WbqC family protein n=1 Tax=Noviherbaspirillum sp. Root189 TaxID=1736487 RepID=UPI00070E697A|nr:WbqC family protein [Noviherbaspirillum sp. Root189]KRB81846.1 hypothetical protein ASE07_24180 [Noviherbaspirillum sp. Root189]